MIRQSLDADSAYADVALHGDGLTSLQYRDTKGATTHEIQSNISAPERLRIEKRGDYVYMWLGARGRKVATRGAPMRSRSGPIYVGIGVCSHDKDAIEKAEFSNVELKQLACCRPSRNRHCTARWRPFDCFHRPPRGVLHSRAFRSAQLDARRRVYFQSRGRILRLPVTGGKPQTIDTGFADSLQQRSRISPDGKWLAISDQSQGDHNRIIYMLPVGGGTPRRVTQKSPSYWHGWSPDGKTVAYPGATQRRVRHLHHFRRKAAKRPADHREGSG